MQTDETTTQNADPRARAERRRPRFRERTVVHVSRGIWDQKKQREQTERGTVRSESEATTKILLPSQAPLLRTVPWTTWERACGGREASAMPQWKKTHEQHTNHTRDMSISEHEMTVSDDKNKKSHQEMPISGSSILQSEFLTWKFTPRHGR